MNHNPTTRSASNGRHHRRRTRLTAAGILSSLALFGAACASDASSDSAGGISSDNTQDSAVGTQPTSTDGAASETPAPESSTTSVLSTTSTSTPAPDCRLRTGRASFEFSGEERSYRIALPDERERVPLVLAFHGFGYSADAHETQTATETVGTAAGFAVVTPDGLGTPKRWHLEGSPIMVLGGGVDGADSIAFGDALIAELLATGCFDDDRVFATGFSNGGELAIQMACEGRSRLAGLGLVASLNTRPACDRDPIAVVSVSNVGDPNLPYEGGELLGGPTVDSARDTIAAWAATNGCAAEPAVEPIAILVTTVSFAGCDADTLLHEIDWDAHVWAGAPDDPVWGAAPQDVSATELLLEAFTMLAWG